MGFWCQLAWKGVSQAFFKLGTLQNKTKNTFAYDNLQTVTFEKHVWFPELPSVKVALLIISDSLDFHSHLKFTEIAAEVKKNYSMWIYGFFYLCLRPNNLECFYPNLNKLFSFLNTEETHKQLATSFS